MAQGKGIRRRLSAEELKELWARWKVGDGPNDIAKRLGVALSSIYRPLTRAGGIAPSHRTRAARTLSLAEREEISRGVAADLSACAMARALGRAPSTISREIRRHGTRSSYRAGAADAVANALSDAHQHGVIHRDLKPENILLQHGQPVIADFGIALAVSNAGGQRVTQTGLSLGTPQYMSPEQATGDRTIDGRTDIFSLGAVLYEMLTGEPPHTGNTAQAVIARLMTERPRPVRASRETVPENVEHAVDIALAKLPADRFSSAADFARALQGDAGVTFGAPLRRASATSVAWWWC